MGIRSSLVSLTRDTSVDPQDYRDYVVALGRDAVLLYRLTRELIRRERFEIVAFFNGRFAPVRAIRRACEELGIRYFVHERGSSIDKICDLRLCHAAPAQRLSELGRFVVGDHQRPSWKRTKVPGETAPGPCDELVRLYAQAGAGNRAASVRQETHIVLHLLGG